MQFAVPRTVELGWVNCVARGTVARMEARASLAAQVAFKCCCFLFVFLAKLSRSLVHASPCQFFADAGEEEIGLRRIQRSSQESEALDVVIVQEEIDIRS